MVVAPPRSAECAPWCPQDTRDKVRKLNQVLNGWANYFCLGPVVQVMEAVQKHVRQRLRRWLCLKHKVRTRAYGHFPNALLHDTLGLVRLVPVKHRQLWAHA